jgi:N-acetylmuramic acid 6-phosphate etherase
VNKTHRKPRGTEERNPRLRELDLLSTPELVRVINQEDATVPAAVRRELPAISRAVDAIVDALSQGGRLLYVGAGTSGRLATLDAAECPPTFGVSPKLVQAVVAGGQRVLAVSLEGAEDDARQGARDLASKRIARADVVVGIAASGSTPYVVGALQLARRRGATTIAVTANRGTPIERLAEITIAPETGPEVVTGSTRMKAGTAQKLVLNMLSTASMIRLGRVYSNWMVGVALTNEKLRQRGLRILQEATGANEATAAHALKQARNRLRVALVMLKMRAGPREAEQKLKGARGNLRRALGE